jgi:hypothetical protein
MSTKPQSSKMSLKSLSTFSHNTLFHKLLHASSSSSPISIPTSTSPICIHHSHKQTPCLSKRKLNFTLLLTPFLWTVFPNELLLAQELITELQRYTDSKEGFTLLTPSSWTKVNKLSVLIFLISLIIIIIFNVVGWLLLLDILRYIWALSIGLLW